MFVIVEIANTEYHPGEPITLQDVTYAIEGDGCAPDCATRSFKVLNIVEFKAKEGVPRAPAGNLPA